MLYVNPQTAASFSGAGMAPGATKRDAEVLREYEQLFIYQMLKEMRKTVPDYGVVDGKQRAHFDEMLDDFLAGEMARSGQFGIAEQLADQIDLQQKSDRTRAEQLSTGIPLRKTLSGMPLDAPKPEGISLLPRGKGISLYEETALSQPQGPASDGGT